MPDRRHAVLRRADRGRGRQCAEHLGGDCHTRLEACKGVAPSRARSHGFGGFVSRDSAAAESRATCRIIMRAVMDARRWQHVGDIYHEAVALDADARSAFLDRACEADADLRREVESLLVRTADASSF